MSQQSKPNFSLEFFPPKTPEGAEKLRVARAKLAELHPAYFSVTFGAGGSTQKGTLETVLRNPPRRPRSGAAFVMHGQLA